MTPESRNRVIAVVDQEIADAVMAALDVIEQDGSTSLVRRRIERAGNYDAVTTRLRAIREEYLTATTGHGSKWSRMYTKKDS
jgi:hypothetical protein